jgi:predicted  nucleic acid-binding Zn-ribbon protein
MDLTLQLIMEQLKRTEGTGQDKAENSISANFEEIKNDISGIQYKIGCGQEELRNEISSFTSNQAELEKEVTEMINKQLKGVITVGEQQVQEMHEEFSNQLQVMIRNTRVA